MNSTKKEIAFSSAELNVLFNSMGSDDVLVGGQALSYWSKQFRLIGEERVFTKDADIFAPYGSLGQIAVRLNGKIILPMANGFGTALHGQIEISKGLDAFLNVDVLRKIPGLNEKLILGKSIHANNQFNIINPIDLLVSKVTNYVKIPEKHNDDGKEQALLSVQVAKCFAEKLVQSQNIDQAVSVAQAVFKLARSNTGLSALNDGVNVFSGIFWEVPNDGFQNEWRPRAEAQIREIMDDLDDGVCLK